MKFYIVSYQHELISIYTFSILFKTRTVECILVKSGNLNWKIIDSEESSEVDTNEKNLYLRRVESAHSLPDSLCVDSGMGRPNSEKSCGIMECPSWIAPTWLSCELSKCVSTNTGE